MGKSYRVAVVPGDGTGPEVIAEGLKVLEAASAKYGFKLTRPITIWAASDISAQVRY